MNKILMGKYMREGHCRQRGEFEQSSEGSACGGGAPPPLPTAAAAAAAAAAAGSVGEEAPGHGLLRRLADAWAGPPPASFAHFPSHTAGSGAGPPEPWRTR